MRRCSRRRKGFVERRRGVRVQVILHQADVLGLRVDLIDEPAHHLGVVVHGALRSHLDVPPAGQWLNQHEQVARATAFVLVIHALRLAWLNRNRRLHISMPHHRLFIQADGRILRVILLLVQVEHIFHGRYELASDCGQAPVFMLPGFEFVFLSSSWMVLGEMFVTNPNSTAFCASKRTVQWSWPSGAGLHATAIRWPVWRPERALRRCCCTLSCKTASSPPWANRPRTLVTVAS